MTDREEMNEERDEALGRALRQWRAPAVPDSLDERVLAGYRRATGAQPWWRRWLTISIPVPMPLAVAALLLLLVSAALVLRRPAEHHALPQLAEGTETRQAKNDPSLAGFQPAEDMNVTVVAGGTAQ
jgi:uncharacterized membrane protein YdfJ with MMPL/SSD domain